MKTPKKDRPIDEKKIMALWRACWPVPEIAAEMGLSSEQAKEIVDRRKRTV